MSAQTIFSIDVPEYTLASLCCDIDDNRSRATHIPAFGRCVYELNLPPIAKTLRCFPRYLVDSRHNKEAGRWITILVEDEMVIRLFVTEMKDLKDYFDYLCKGCDFPKPQCICTLTGVTSDDQLCWMFCTPQGKVIRTIQDLNRATNQAHGYIMASLDYVVSQSGRTYTSLLNEPTEFEPFVKVLEDSVTLFYQFRRSRNIMDITMSVASFIRSVTGRSSVIFMKDLLKKVVDLLGPYFTLQSDAHWTETLSDMYENYSKTKNTILAKRLKKVFNHIIAHSFYHKLGIEVDHDLFRKFEKQKIRPNLVDCLTFVDAIAALLTFILKQGRQAMLSGSIEPMFLSSDTTCQWFVKAKKLKADYEFLNNPSAVGIQIHKYLHDLDTAISEGQCINKFQDNETIDKRAVSGIVTELESMRKRYLSVLAASAVRKQPLGVVLYGSPGVGKSAVMEMLYNYDCLIRGRDPNPIFKYQVPSDSDHFDNYRSWYHTIVLDDAGQHSPSKINGVDPSTGMVIRIANNQSFCPPQASLEDKGKTPMLVDLMFVTTNVLDLNLPIYYPKSYAPMRRLKVHIEPIVKPEFCKENGKDIDPNKAIGRGTYDDFWYFKVRVPVDKGMMIGEFQEIEYPNGQKYFTSTQQLLEWFKPISDEHDRQQRQFLSNIAKYAGAKLCECSLPEQICECPKTQGLRRRANGEIYYTPSDSSEDLDPSECGFSFCDSDSSEKEDLHREWRSNDKSRRARLISNGLQRKFFIVHSKKFSKDWVKDYAFYELPILFQHGWTDVEIMADFKEYLDFKTQTTSNEEVDTFVSIIMESVRKQTGVQPTTLLDAVIKFFIYLYFHYTYVRSTVNFFGQYGCVRRSILPLMRPFLTRTENQKFIMKQLGKNLDNKLGGTSPLIQALLIAASTLCTAGFLMAMHSRMKQPSIESQFGIFPKKKNEPVVVNPWVVPERTVTSLDFCSKRVTEKDVFLRNLTHNILPFDLKHEDHIGSFTQYGNLLAISNNKFITNNHSLPENGGLKMKVYFNAKGDLSDSVCLLLKQSQIQRFPERDLAVITTKAFPARFKNISNNFVKRSFHGRYDGFYFKKMEDGSMVKIAMHGVAREHYVAKIQGQNYDLEVFKGYLPEPTSNGDCGTPLVLNTGFGYVIVGFHSLYHVGENMGSSAAFFYEDLEEIVAEQMDVQVDVVEVSHEVRPAGKSYIDYHESGHIVYHGELAGFRARPKHHVIQSEIASQCFGRKIGGHLIEDRLVAPVMDNWRPQQVGLKEMVHPIQYMDEEIVALCCDNFFKYIVRELPESELELLHTYPIEVAVNGAPGIKYVDAIKKSTSMGYPWKKTKRAYLEPLEDDRFQDGVKFNPEIEQKIFARLEKMKAGLRVHPIFSSNLKDEPVSLKKFLSCKTRVFYSCPTDFLIIVRMCFMGFCRMAQRNRFVFKMAVGLNCHSIEWDELYRYMATQPTNRTIAGDYAFFDKKLKVMMMRHVMDIVIRLYEHAGLCTPVEILIFKVIVHDMVNPSVDYFGMLIQLLGGEVSGHQMTTVFNCLCNVVYMMYCYHVLECGKQDFFDNVNIMTLGDDHIMTVSEYCREFNHTNIQRVMLDLGVDYTMAEKDAETVPFIQLEEAPFLKRTFRFSKELNCYVAPLDVQSIFKMLVIQTASKTISLSEQLAQALCAANSEAFYHGKVFFVEFQNFVDRLEKSDKLKHYITLFPHLSWDQCVLKFKEASNLDPVQAIDTGLSQKCQEKDSDCRIVIPIPQSMRRVDSSSLYHARAFPEIHIDGRLELESQRDGKAHLFELIFGLENNELANRNLKQNLSQSGEELAQKDPALVPRTDDESQSQQQEQVMFVNEPDGEIYDLSTRFNKVGDHQQIVAHLADFLSRPTLIYQYRWSENGAAGLKASFEPWSAFFNKPAIKNKLQGFHLLRANLCLKFLINGSPFYYGRIGAFYRPLARQMTNTVPASIAANVAQIPISQRPHVWLDNQSTSNVMMILPFLYPYPYVSTANTTNLDDLGTLELWQYAALRSANGVTTSGVDITVYAYATDFELAGATSIAVLQSQREYEQDGQISGPASTVASVASSLKNVPLVGPYATATETAAKMVAGVANYFGYTNVPNTSDVNPMKQIPFNLASAEISEPVLKLSLQPKQEIASGAEHFGDIGGDQLTLKSLLQRESFLCGSLWSTTYAINERLFTAAVAPAYYEYVGGINGYVGHTPLSYFSTMFEYWRGSIIFRFKVVRSQYHRGRINICWDVGATSLTATPEVGDSSTFNVVLDLDESDEVEVKIPYTKAKQFLRSILNYSELPTAKIWDNSTTPALIVNGEYNGVISVRVMNRLTAPEATSDVDLLVFVRGGEDLTLAGPVDIQPSWTHSAIENTVLQSEKVYCLGNSGDDTDVFREVFGEQIVSLRELLHRSSLSCMMTGPITNTTDGTTVVVVPFKRYPRPPGFYDNGWDSAIDSGGIDAKPYNYTRMHPINWVVTCFIGVKGSVNVTFNHNQLSTSQSVDSLSVTRVSTGPTMSAAARRRDYWTQSTIGSTSDSSINRTYNRFIERWGEDGISGSALTNQKTNTGLSVNLPYYANSGFLITDPYVQYSNKDTITSGNSDWWRFRYKVRKDPTVNTLRPNIIEMYYSTGPDFDVVFFLNCPVTYWKYREPNAVP